MISPSQIELVTDTTSQDERTVVKGALKLRSEVTVDNFLVGTPGFDLESLNRKAKVLIWGDIYGEIADDVSKLMETVRDHPPVTPKSYEAVRLGFANILKKLELKK